MQFVLLLVACFLYVEGSAPHRGHHAGYAPAPSNNEAYVNRINAERQLYVNRIAAKIGTGTGTGFLDGVPGTPLQRKRPYGNHGYGAGYGNHGYNAGYGNHGAAYGAHGAGYGKHTAAYGVHGAGYGKHTAAYGVHGNAYGAHGNAYGVHGNAYGHGLRGNAYGIGHGHNVAGYGVHGGRAAYGASAAYGAHHGVGHHGGAAYGKGYGGYNAGYHAGHGYGKEDNAVRQHQVNLVALHRGSGVGTAPLYGVPGTHLAAHPHKGGHLHNAGYGVGKTAGRIIGKSAVQAGKH